VTNADVSVTEQLVFETKELASLYRKVPTSGETHRFATCRAIKRLGNRGTPVDDDRFAQLIGNGEATDVEALDLVGALGVSVDATEHQCGVAEVELGEPVDQGLVENVSLVPRLESTAESGFGQIAQLPCVDAALLETRVGVVDECLLFGEIGVRRGHVGSCIWPFLGSVERTCETLQSAGAAHTLERDRVMLLASGTSVPPPVASPTNTCGPNRGGTRPKGPHCAKRHFHFTNFPRARRHGDLRNGGFFSPCRIGEQ
jgi:hypothetical protein